MKRFFLFSLIFMGFSYAADPTACKFKTLSQLSDGSSKFHEKCEKISHLERSANPDINLKYFKIINKTDVDIFITLKYPLEWLSIPTTYLYGSYALELLTKANEFSVSAVINSFDTGFRNVNRFLPELVIEDNATYEITINTQTLIIHGQPYPDPQLKVTKIG